MNVQDCSTEADCIHFETYKKKEGKFFCNILLCFFFPFEVLPEDLTHGYTYMEKLGSLQFQ